MYGAALERNVQFGKVVAGDAVGPESDKEIRRILEDKAHGTEPPSDPSAGSSMSLMRISIAEMLIWRTANGSVRRSAYWSLKMRLVDSRTSTGRHGEVPEHPLHAGEGRASENDPSQT